MKLFTDLQKRSILMAILFAMSCSFANISAQVISTDLKAIVSNGKIAIQVKDALSTLSYFSLGANGQVEVSFYFGIDDPRNGNYWCTISTIQWEN